jgi:hypothetical protein
MAQPPSSADLISQVIQGMWAQGLVVAPSSSFPHLPPGFPAQSIPQHPVSQGSFSFQHMMRPPHVPYAPVQQVDDPNIWRVSGASSPLGPPPLRPPIVMAPPHQPDDPRMFGSTDPNPPSTVVPQGASPDAGQFGSPDPNPGAAQSSLDELVSQRDTTMLDVEGLQGPGDTSTPNQIDEPMHDAYAEIGLGQGPDAQPLQDKVPDVGGEGGGERGGAPGTVEASTSSRHDQGEVTH